MSCGGIKTVGTTRTCPRAPARRALPAIQQQGQVLALEPQWRMRNRFVVGLGLVGWLVTIGCDGDEAAKHVQDGGSDAGRVQRPPLPPDYAGKVCEAPSDCEPAGTGCGLSGQCTAACTPSDAEDFCGAGAACVSVYPKSFGTCQRLCDSDSDCLDGLECRPGAELRDIGYFSTAATFVVNGAIDSFLRKDESVTVPVATADAVAIDPDELPKTCRRPLRVVQLEDGVVGSRCKIAEACGSGQCLAAINVLEYTPDGYCSGVCTSDDQCGAAGVCYRNAIEAHYEMEGTCLLGCAGDDAQCHEGEVCRASPVLGGDATYCLPRQPLSVRAKERR